MASGKADDSVLDEIATELYGLAPRDFTAARNARAKEARQAGDKALADAVGALGKPTTVGWLANQLVRQQPDEVQALLDLGESLREATASLAGAQLRELSRQQRQVVYALVQQARGLANAAGQPVSEDTARGLEETLHAAMADPDAAAQLAAGHLTGVLSRSGFPGDAAAPTPPRSGRTATDASRERRGPDAEDTTTQQRAAAERDERQAREAAETSAAERDRAQQSLDEANQAVADAIERIEDLKRQLSEANGAQTEAQRRLRTARDAADKADRLARRSAQRLAEAEQRRHRLDD